MSTSTRLFGLRTLIQSSKPCKALAGMETSGCLDVLVICVPDMHAKLAGVQIEGERERENEQELQGNKQTHGFAGPPTILLPLEEVLHLGSLLLGLLRRAVRLTYALGNRVQAEDEDFGTRGYQGVLARSCSTSWK